MPKTLQAPAVIILVALLVLMRVVPTIDPIAPLMRTLFGRDEPAQSLEADNNEGQLKALEDQIATLEKELDFKRRADNELVGAHVISKTAVSFRQALRIDRGSQDGIRPDQPVFYGGHLVGITRSVEQDASTVLLIGDPDVSVPVRIGQAQGIVRAYAGGVLVDQVVGPVEPAQPVVTSGVGGLYPPGLIVGNIGSEIERDIFGQYVLERPSRLFELEIVQVAL